MNPEEHFRRLEKMYLASKVNRQLYPTTQVTISNRKAVISIDISDRYFHALNAIHGSVYFKLLDDAAFFAVNSVVTDKFVLTTNFSLNLIRPVTEGRIEARGELSFQSRNLFIAEARLYNAQDKEVAFGTGHFMKSQIDLTKEIGY